MLKIAVCDDNSAELREIMAMIEEYPRKSAYGIEATAFSNSEALAKKIDEFDIFVLDYMMPGMDGLELSKLIRKKYQTAKTIIFITKYDDIVYDAFEVRTHRYLLKPLDRNKLYKALDELNIDAYSFRQLLAKSNGESKLIDIDSIYFIEISLKDAFIHYEEDGEEKVFRCRKSLKSLEDELTPFWFFRTHRSYLTNLRRIESFDTRCIYIKDLPAPLPMGHSRAGLVSKQLLKMAKQRIDCVSANGAAL